MTTNSRTSDMQKFEDRMKKEDDARRKRYQADNDRMTRQLERYVAKCGPIEGLVGEWKIETHYYGGGNVTTKSYVLRDAANKCEFELSIHGGGHTRFEVEGKGTRTFDRRGVSDSFYWIDYSYTKGKADKPKELGPLIAEEMRRIQESRGYHLTALQVPGLPFTLAPDRVAQVRTEIEKRGTYTFMPSGFGTGYTLSQKQRNYTRRATKELEEFIGLSPLYICSFDAD